MELLKEEKGDIVSGEVVTNELKEVGEVGEVEKYLE